MSCCDFKSGRSQCNGWHQVVPHSIQRGSGLGAERGPSVGQQIVSTPAVRHAASPSIRAGHNPRKSVAYSSRARRSWNHLNGAGSGSLDDFGSRCNRRPTGSIAAPQLLRRDLPHLRQGIDVPAVAATVTEEQVGPILAMPRIPLVAGTVFTGAFGRVALQQSACEMPWIARVAERANRFLEERRICGALAEGPRLFIKHQGAFL